MKIKITKIQLRNIIRESIVDDFLKDVEVNEDLLKFVSNFNIFKTKVLKSYEGWVRGKEATAEELQSYLLSLDKAMPDQYSEGFLIVFSAGIGILVSKWGLKYLSPTGLVVTWATHKNTLIDVFKKKGPEATMNLYVELFKNL
mgnify:CR=1 FL=1|tara:strand:- start:312 stop:740 length:429 start_codon:yes stop_codon:yes gene_type:complete